MKKLETFTLPVELQYASGTFRNRLGFFKEMFNTDLPYDLECVLQGLCEQEK